MGRGGKKKGNPPKTSSKAIAVHNGFNALMDNEAEEMERPPLPPEHTILKLLFVGNYLSANRNKSKKEIPIDEVDKNAIIRAHDLLLYSRGKESLEKSFEAGCSYADNYASAEPDLFLTLKGKQFSYFDVRKKVDGFSAHNHFREITMRSAAEKLVPSTPEKLKLTDFLKEHPHLLEPGKGGLLTTLGYNIVRGLLDRIIIRCEERRSGGLKPQYIFVVNKVEGYIEIDTSTVQPGDGSLGLADDLSAFRSVILLIKAEYDIQSVLFTGLQKMLMEATRLRDVRKLRSYPLLSTVSERISLLNDAKSRIAANTYYRFFLHYHYCSANQPRNLNWIRDAIRSHHILSQCPNNDDGSNALGPPIDGHATTGHCVSLLRNKVFHMNNYKAPDDCICDRVLDAAVREVFPDVYPLLFRVNILWKTHHLKDRSR